MAKTGDDHASSSSSSALQHHFGISPNRELSLIDRGLVEVPEIVNNYRHLVSINLHGNNITVLRGLEHLSDTLRFLDVSSNRLNSMSGLTNLHELVYLNLASNRLTSVGSISKLRSLRYINLAYNRISGLSGFRQLALANMANCALERVDLQGNCLSSIDLIVTAFCEFHNLHELHLTKDDATNPVCSMSSYRGRLLGAMSQLSLLDGCDRFGNPIVDNGWLQQEDIMSDLVLSLIDSNFAEKPVGKSSIKPPPNPKSVNTPHVDAVLSRIRKGQQRELDKMARVEMAVDANENEDEQEATPPSPSISSPPKRTAKIEEPSEQTNKVMALYEARLKELESELSRLKSSVGQQSAAMIQTKPAPQPVLRVTDVGVQAERHQHHPPQQQQQQQTKASHHHRPLTSGGKREVEGDAEHRREAAKTFGELVRQIEGERERRFKAEVAAKKLADAVRVMEDRVMQFQEIATTVEAEHKARVKAEEEVKRLTSELSEANLRLPQLDALLQKANHEVTRLKVDQDESVKKLLVAERKALEMEAESKRFHSQVSDLERRLGETQATLASREAEHRRENSGRDFTERISSIETLWKERLESEKRHSEELGTKYRQLEDEFRDALRIEAGRFDTLEEEYRRTSDEERKTKAALKSTEQRLAQHQHASAQLTSVVKTLKTRLTEAEKEYSGKISEYESRITTGDKELAECRKQVQAAELLRQEKVKLIAELQALQSIVEGLRSERKHWGEELAKQGAQLSSDRGRLESRIESLTVEVSGLRRELDKETEAVKVKTKVIDDQLDTIRKLKDALVEREKQLKEARNECIELQKQVDDHENELKESAAALETSDRRASEWKKRAVDLQSENEKWRERITGIGELETKVVELSKNSQEKEKQLHEEKTKLAMELETAKERLRVLDDRFREQLELTQVEHARTLERVRSEAANDVAKAQSRVRQVEDEMRTLLLETDNQRRAMEARVKQLQTGLSQLVGIEIPSTTSKQQTASATS